MNRNSSAQIKIYKIYALLHPSEAICYVGKTAGRRLSAAYSEHICQRVEVTEAYFDKQENRPELYLLNTLECNTSIAYKYMVAWTRVFLDAGYFSLNHDGTQRQAGSLRADTQAIVDGIRQEPLSAILERTRLEKPTAADAPPEKREEPGPLIQMNLRIATADKERFAAYCKSGGMTQREGFSLLLDRLPPEGESRQMRLLQELREKNRKLHSENRKLRNRLAVMSGAELPKSVRRSLKLLDIQKEGVARYLERILPPAFDGERLKRGNYRRYMKRRPTEEVWVYPEGEGTVLLTLKAVLWGNALHRACFLIGVGEHGERYKLRYYPKASYAGIPLEDDRYFRQDARFLVSFQQAEDGAKELVLAMPLPELLSETADVPEVQTPAERKPSLDERIRNIETGR